MEAESFRGLPTPRRLLDMTTNTNTVPASSGHGSAARVPDAHALESRREAVEHAPSPVRERLAHPLRPAERRPVRAPHGTAGTAPGRTTSPGTPPLPARLPLAEPGIGSIGDVVPPTVLPDPSGDLLGLPDLGPLVRALRAGWAWLVRQARASAEIDARLRARRDEDSAAMARGGVGLNRLL